MNPSFKYPSKWYHLFSRKWTALITSKFRWRMTSWARHLIQINKEIYFYKIQFSTECTQTLTVKMSSLTENYTLAKIMMQICNFVTGNNLSEQEGKSFLQRSSFMYFPHVWNVGVNKITSLVFANYVAAAFKKKHMSLLLIPITIIACRIKIKIISQSFCLMTQTILSHQNRSRKTVNDKTFDQLRSILSIPKQWSWQKNLRNIRRRPHTTRGTLVYLNNRNLIDLMYSDKRQLNLLKFIWICPK